MIDRDLCAALEVVLDRVFDRNGVPLLDIDLSQAGVERGCLAGTSRAARKEQARISGSDRAEFVIHPRVQAKLVQPARTVAGIKYSDDQFLAVDRRRQAHSIIDAAAFDGHGEVSILHLIFLAGLDLAENFHDAEQPLEDLLGELHCCDHAAVDT